MTLDELARLQAKEWKYENLQRYDEAVREEARRAEERKANRPMGLIGCLALSSIIGLSAWALIGAVGLVPAMLIMAIAAIAGCAPTQRSPPE